MFNKKIFVVWLLLSTSLTLHAETISTVFGNINEKNPLILELIDSPTMQRLKNIDQSGPLAYFGTKCPRLSRYEHSLGVYALLKRYNVSTNEQIAGLLHDASHTVFSHLADILFQQGAQRTESYQDVIHNWFLTKTNVAALLEKYHIKLTDISPKNDNFTALEQPYPDMNADRIEYNLHTALIFQDLDQDDINKILNSLQYKDHKWYFTDIVNAKKFSTLSSYYTRAIWGSDYNIALYTVTTATIKYALEKEIITEDEIHFGVDQEIISTLMNSTDPIIVDLMVIMQNIESYYETSDKVNCDVLHPIKARCIDPLVLYDGKLQRLSTLSMDFNNDLQNAKKFATSGSCIKFINITNPKIMQLLLSANK